MTQPPAPPPPPPGGWGPGWQQPEPGPQQPQQWSYPPPPKRGLSTNVLVLSIVGVLVLAGAVVAIIIATSGDDGKPQAGGSSGPSTSASASFPSSTGASTGPSTGTGAGGANDVLTKWVASLTAHDLSTYRGLLCDDIEPPALKDITAGQLALFTKASVTKPAQESGSTAVGSIATTAGGDAATNDITLAKQANGWCIQKVGGSGVTTSESASAGSASASPSPVQAAALAGAKFVAALQAHSLTGLEAVTCKGRPIRFDQASLNAISKAYVNGLPTLNSATTATQKATIVTKSGSSSVGKITTHKLDSRWCVYSTGPA